MSRWFAKIALSFGVGLLALSAVGFLFFYESPGRDVRLVLVGGGDVPGGTEARLRLATGGETLETTLRIKDRTADGFLLRLPAASAPALAEIILQREDAVLWKTAPFLDAPLPPPAKDDPPPEPQTLTADHAALLPLIGGNFACDAGTVHTVAIQRAGSGTALIAEIDGQTHPVVAFGDGWTAGALRLLPIDGALLLRDAKDQMQFCQSDQPPELLGLRLSGPDWTLVLHDQSIGWAVAGAPPALFPAAGTVTQKTMRLLGGTRIDSIAFRSQHPQAPTITATPATCLTEPSDVLRDWQVAIRAGDGKEWAACIPGAPYPLPAVYTLENGATAFRPVEFVLNGRSFSTHNDCNAYAGYLRPQPDGYRLQITRRDMAPDCKWSKSPFVRELDQILTEGAILRLSAGRRMELAADVPKNLLGLSPLTLYWTRQ